MLRFNSVIVALGFLLLYSCQSVPNASQDSTSFHLEVDQLTQGPNHHFFGYIGHVQNVPWNGSGRYILSFQVDFIDRMPTPEDVADILILDSENNYEPRKVDETRAWNPQQGSMMYWNPDAPETQFFFNDRDPETNEIFCVLFDIEKNKRIKEYRYEDTPFGNGGIRQTGGSFAGINYGRMARLRPVTGYPEAYDWNPEELHPTDDGIFVVDIESGEKRLLVSFKQMRDLLVEDVPRIDSIPLFINHSLWNRDGDRLFFFCRGRFGNRSMKVNEPMTIMADGTGLTRQKVFIGGHPEWEFGSTMIGVLPKIKEDGSSERDGRLVLYDSEQGEVIREIGTHDIFPDPGNDIALSPDGRWLVQGFEEGSKTAYSVFRRSDSAYAHTSWFDQRQYYTGDLRIDAAPKWNRNNDQILFSSLTDEENPTRQLFLIRVVMDAK
ncbi:MAG: hypothetical protein AAF587_37000 [Bacteroidota bacterium]